VINYDRLLSQQDESPIKPDDVVEVEPFKKLEVENPESGGEHPALWEPYDFEKLREPLFPEDVKFSGLTNIF